MRKYVYVRIQRILMFIPIVNISIWFIWGYNSHILNIPKGAVLKSDFIAFCHLLVASIPYMFLGEIFDYGTIMSEVIDYILMYLAIFAMAYSLVKSQEKLGLE